MRQSAPPPTIPLLRADQPAPVVLQAQNLSEFQLYFRVVHIGQLAPVEEAFVITEDPFDGLFLEKGVVGLRGSFAGKKIDDGFLPGLLQDGGGKTPLRAESRVRSLFPGNDGEILKAHINIITREKPISEKKFHLRSLEPPGRAPFRT